MITRYPTRYERACYALRVRRRRARLIALGALGAVWALVRAVGVL